MEKKMDKKKSGVKQEHYVPKSYLAWFADDNEKICVYDYEKKEYRKNQSIEKVAKIGAFYDFDEENLEYMRKFKENIDEQYIERMFSKNIEPALKDIIEKLSNLDMSFINNCPSIVNHNLKLSISYLLVFQFLRTRTARKFFEEIFRDDKVAAFQHKKMLLNQESIEDLANYICNMCWTFCYNMSERPYITSDNPVVIVDHDFCYGSIALMSDQKKIIQYPLSPQILLLILDEGYTGENNSNTMNVMINDAENLESVDFPNSLQMENAYQYVFTSGEFDENYFENKKAGYVDQPMSPQRIEYEKDLEELIQNAPRLYELLGRLESPECTAQEKEKIMQECHNIYKKVNEDRLRLGMSTFEIRK